MPNEKRLEILSHNYMDSQFKSGICVSDLFFIDMNMNTDMSHGKKWILLKKIKIYFLKSKNISIR